MSATETFPFTLSLAADQSAAAIQWTLAKDALTPILRELNLPGSPVYHYVEGYSLNRGIAWRRAIEALDTARGAHDVLVAINNLSEVYLGIENAHTQAPANLVRYRIRDAIEHLGRLLQYLPLVEVGH